MAKILGCKRDVKIETHAMSLIRSGYAVSRRWGMLGVLFTAVLALSLFYLAVFISPSPLRRR
jgi:hypothetical protein